jgi:hypothetical protein
MQPAVLRLGIAFVVAFGAITFSSGLSLFAQDDSKTTPFASHPINRWVKRTPIDGAPISPRLGYEGACVWDSRHRLVVRYGGHNQGGGGEQGAEVWTFDPLNSKWTLKEPDTSPPGVCCNQQNVYDPTISRYVRFPKFSGSHGWQWQRELYLNDSSVWTYDLAANRWSNLRPVPAPRLAGLRCASWDSDRQVVVVFGGEGSHEGTLIYDPWRNEWSWPKPASEPPGRSGGNMAYDRAHEVHILFGSQFDKDAHTWAYSVERNEWRDLRPPVQPPTDQNDAVLTYDPIHRVVLALIKVSSGDGDDEKHVVETWSYNGEANEWTRLRPETEPDAAGNRTRSLVFAPELGVAILENCTSRPREQQIWTYRYADSKETYTPPAPVRRSAPPIVTDLVVSVVSRKRVELTWTAPSRLAEIDDPKLDPRVVAYHIERASVAVWSDDQLSRLDARTPPLAGSASVGAIRSIGAFITLTKEPVITAKFVDGGIDLAEPNPSVDEPIYESGLHAEHLDPSGAPYRFAVFAYRVRAVDREGNVSGPSPAILTIPSSPRHVFSRESGATCELRWAANPEQGIAGYRVYRMDGRWDTDAVSRLTLDPTQSTTYADETAAESTRRYYIIAVDALGQEGFPSSPVWYRREWRAYYEPFVGEWHQ